MAPVFDLEERTIRFTKEVIAFTKDLPPTIANKEISRQLVRAAGSVGANYIEASENLSTKDFLLHIKISRKEAKEARYWLLTSDCPPEVVVARDRLCQEATELMLILSAIMRKAQSRNLSSG